MNWRIMMPNLPTEKQITEFSYLTRQETLNRLQEEKFDLLVIGGGITGAGIAYDAVMRGIKVALVEKGDFASGTSSKTARMVHGGLRYLQQFQLGLVRQSLREREILYKLAPRLVKPTPFIHLIRKGDKANYFIISIGMWLYDLLSFFRNYRLHRMLSLGKFKNLEPQIRIREVVGAAKFYDCLADDARFTLEIVRSAYYYGARVANYLKATKLAKEAGRVSGAVLKDVISGKEIVVKSNVVVNATGVWADEIRLMDDPSAPKIVRANRGTHIILPKNKLKINNVVTFTGIDGKRGLYIVPWKNTCIAGTTDVDHQGNFDNVSASTEEVKFIIDSINAVFEDVNISFEDIISTYAGLRPLLKSEDESAYLASREHEILISDQGLISVAGGKLTTHRQMAQEVVNEVVKILKKQFDVSKLPRCRTKEVPIAQEEFDLKAEELDDLYHRLGLSLESLQRLFSIYGVGYRGIIDLILNNPELGGKLIPALPYLKAEVTYSVKFEMAMTLEDTLIRRLHIFHEAQDQGLSVAREIASLMGSHFGWDHVEIDRQFTLYKKEVKQNQKYTTNGFDNVTESL
jgi:glycerol-3-phosphate dehydrogenase